MKIISIKEYSQLKSTIEYDSVFLHLQPSDIFINKFNIEKLSYKEVKAIVNFLPKALDFNKILAIYKTAFQFENDFDFWDATIDLFFSTQKFLIETFSKIVKKEKELMKSLWVDLVLWQSAGGDKLNKFSDLLPLMQLGEIYSMYPIDLQDKPYNEILVILFANKQKNEVQQKFNELKSKQ